MSEILDQSDLTEKAARLVAAAKRAGADAADAVCVRGVSQSVEVRLGKVEDAGARYGVAVRMGEDIEHRLTDAVGGRPYAVAAWRQHRAAAKLTGDDPHGVPFDAGLRFSVRGLLAAGRHPGGR